MQTCEECPFDGCYQTLWNMVRSNSVCIYTRYCQEYTTLIIKLSFLTPSPLKFKKQIQLKQENSSSRET